MDYERKKKEVQAVKLAASIYDEAGNALAKRGDWLVIENDRQYYMTNDEFTEEFQPKAKEVPSIPYVPYPVYPVYPRGPYWDYYHPSLGYGTWSSSGVLTSKAENLGSDQVQSFNNFDGAEMPLPNCTYESRA